MNRNKKTAPSFSWKSQGCQVLDVLIVGHISNASAEMKGCPAHQLYCFSPILLGWQETVYQKGSSTAFVNDQFYPKKAFRKGVTYEFIDHHQTLTLPFGIQCLYFVPLVSFLTQLPMVKHSHHHISFKNRLIGRLGCFCCCHCLGCSPHHSSVYMRQSWGVASVNH